MIFGQTGADVLDHSLVPFRSRARYLRLVSTKSQAADYAAGGFHVSVTRGLAGGCRDSSADFASGGTKMGVCLAPIASENIRQLWIEAAAAYMGAYQDATNGSAGLEYVKGRLRVANALADKAYAAEGVAPPVDPVVVATGGQVAPMPEPPAAPRKTGWVVALATLTLFAGLTTATAIATRDAA